MDEFIDRYIEHLDKKILKVIQQKRKEQKISRKKLSEDLQLNPHTYADMEKGRITFPLNRLLAVMKYLGITSLLDPAQEKSLVVVDDFESFMKKFNRQTIEMENLRAELTAIREMLELLLSKQGENPTAALQQ